MENVEENILTKQVIGDIAVKKQKLMLWNGNKSSKPTPETLKENIQKIKDLKRALLDHETSQIDKIKGK